MYNRIVFNNKEEFLSNVNKYSFNLKNGSCSHGNCKIATGYFKNVAKGYSFVLCEHCYSENDQLGKEIVLFKKKNVINELIGLAEKYKLPNLAREIFYEISKVFMEGTEISNQSYERLMISIENVVNIEFEKERAYRETLAYINNAEEILSRS